MYAKHRFNIFPEMQDEDYQMLVNDIKTNGFDAKQPIYLFEGDVLDGWNRQRACTELNITPVYMQYKGTNEEALMFVLRTNKRRNLTSSQWAAIAVEADDVIDVIREETERARREKQSASLKETHSSGLFGETNFPKQINNNKNFAQKFFYDVRDEESNEKQKEENKSATKLAGIFNTNSTYIKEAAKLKETKPEIFEAVKRGEKNITEVKKEEKKEARKQLIEQQIEDIETGKLPELKGLYDVISVDPPWPYGGEYDPAGSRVANPYPEMSIDEIKAIEMPFKNDAVLFLWTTHQFLPSAFEILKHWGFEYKATLVWNKEKIGMGAWLRMQCEFCLVAIKGNPYWENTTERDIINEARREHSRKPDAFFSMVEKITIGRRLEYFSREQRNGWDVFGNDTEKFELAG